jgi:hypothetical protein
MMKNDISSLGASSVRRNIENIDFISSHFSNSEVDLKSEVKEEAIEWSSLAKV